MEYLEYIILAILAIIIIAIFSCFRPHKTEKIADNLYTVNCLFVNFYILKLKEKIVVFDTGINAILAKRGLKKLGISPNDVTHIFLTHSDGDHAGGISAFSNASLFLPKEEEQMINGTKARRFIIYNKKPKKEYHLLSNNDILNIDGTIVKIVFAPGHTPGSSIYVIDDKVCVSGDLLRITRKGNLTQFMRMMNMNHKENLDSLNEKLDLLNSMKRILSGHTGILNK